LLPIFKNVILKYFKDMNITNVVITDKTNNEELLKYLNKTVTTMRKKYNNKSTSTKTTTTKTATNSTTSITTSNKNNKKNKNSTEAKDAKKATAEAKHSLLAISEQLNLGLEGEHMDSKEEDFKDVLNLNLLQQNIFSERRNNLRN